MEKDIKKKAVIPFIVFLGFVALSVNSLCHGIANNEKWRITLASISGLTFVGLIVSLVYWVIKKERKAA